jgi:hypothetical protein
VHGRVEMEGWTFSDLPQARGDCLVAPWQAASGALMERCGSWVVPPGSWVAHTWPLTAQCPEPSPGTQG